MTKHRRAGAPKKWMAAVCAVTAAIGSVSAIALTSSGARADTAPTTFPLPANDPFYTAPSNLASLANGAVIRSRTSPAKLTFYGYSVPLTAWQIAYRSNDAHDQPITAVTTLVVPTAKYTGPAASRPLIAYLSAEDSLGSQCAPSYTLAINSSLLTGQEQAGMALALIKGNAMSIADYEGPTSAYMVGPQAAHIALDGIRAVESFSAGGFTKKTPVGVWGYSGGGHAAGWVGELQSSYAPELTLSGIAMGGAPANLTNSFKQMNGGPFVGFALGAMVGLSHGYPEWDLQSQLNAKGKAVYVSIDQKCTADFVVNTAFTNLDKITNTPGSLDQPQNQAIIKADDLGQRKPAAPVYDYYSLLDEAVPTADSENLIKKYCSWGVPVVPQPVLLSDHYTLGTTKAGDAIDFLDNRFAGKPLPTTCKL